MTVYEYEKWIIEHCPFGVDEEDFIDSLAMGSISIVEDVSRKTKKPISELVAGFFDLPHALRPVNH